MKRIIRDLQEKDIQAIENIYALYWPDDEFRKKLSVRLRDVIDNTTDSIHQGFKYFVAEEGGEVMGSIGFRKVPEHMHNFAITENPAELYILVVKNRGTGVGKLLMNKAVKEVESLGYTEVVFYSGETHKESWGFYDHLGFEKVGSAIAPNGEPGYVWRRVLGSSKF